MGTPKCLVPYENDRTWLTYQILKLVEAGVSETLVVFGHHSEKYLNHYSWGRDSIGSWVDYEGMQLRTVVNEKPERGQFSSLQVGIRNLDVAYEGAFIFPVDTPCAKEEVWLKLKLEMKDGIDLVSPEFEGKGGHPILASENFLKGLLDLDPEAEESRLDLQIKKIQADNYKRLPVDDGQIIQNLNTPEDFKLWSDKNKG